MHVRAELAKYFTITAKSIKVNRNNVAYERLSKATRSTCERTVPEIQDAPGTSCQVIGSPLRPCSKANPASEVVAETRPG